MVLASTFLRLGPSDEEPKPRFWKRRRRNLSSSRVSPTRSPSSTHSLIESSSSRHPNRTRMLPPPSSKRWLTRERLHSMTMDLSQSIRPKQHRAYRIRELQPLPSAALSNLTGASLMSQRFTSQDPHLRTLLALGFIDQVFIAHQLYALSSRH